MAGVGKISLAPVEGAKDPHAPPPGTYFQRDRPNGNGRVLADGGELMDGWMDGWING